MTEKVYTLHYNEMLDTSVRHVIKEVLVITEQQGLPGPHHFYITFLTHYPGIVISSYLQDNYPDEMTIVLQNQFWNLKVNKIGFGVTLLFNQVNETLWIPFLAITAFIDPFGKFIWRFGDQEAIQKATLTSAQESPSAANTLEYRSEKEQNKKKETGNVIALDMFRK